jgi:hypothetical protein
MGIKRRELLLLILIEDASKLFKVIGHSKVSEKIEKNLERLYVNERPDTGPLRKELGI